MIDVIVDYFQRRRKFFILGYLIGYLGSLATLGTPSLSYYIPIKIHGFFFAWLVGNVSYQMVEDKKKGKSYDIFKVMYGSIKHSILGFILCLLIAQVIIFICHLLGVDCSPFIDT